MTNLVHGYFAFDPQNGFKTFGDALSAVLHSATVLERYRCEAHDGWDEDVKRVCWGTIKQVAFSTQEAAGLDYRVHSYWLTNPDAANALTTLATGGN